MTAAVEVARIISAIEVHRVRHDVRDDVSTPVIRSATPPPFHLVELSDEPISAAGYAQPAGRPVRTHRDGPLAGKPWQAYVVSTDGNTPASNSKPNQ
jgi:hypothetical protein